MSDADPIVDVIDRWHAHLRGELAGGLDELLADQVGEVDYWIKSEASMMRNFLATLLLSQGVAMLQAGDEITGRLEIVSIETKEGRSGIMDFVKTRATYRNQSDQVVVIARATMVLRR